MNYTITPDKQSTIVTGCAKRGLIAFLNFQLYLVNIHSVAIQPVDVKLLSKSVR